jgi:hypothetical protein
MIAPNYIRKALLDEAIAEAVNILDEPIDKVEVAGDYVIVRTRSRILKLRSSFGHGTNPGSWSWGFTERDEKPAGLIARLKNIFAAK